MGLRRQKFLKIYRVINCDRKYEKIMGGIVESQEECTLKNRY